MSELTANEARPRYVYPQGWGEWPFGWRLHQAERGYNGNPPRLYVTSPKGVQYVFDPNFHDWRWMGEVERS